MRNKGVCSVWDCKNRNTRMYDWHSMRFVLCEYHKDTWNELHPNDKLVRVVGKYEAGDE